MYESGPYPESAGRRRDWIKQLRPEHNRVDVHRPYALKVDKEREADGSVIDSAVIFLTNRECPWQCLMCDLWKNTLPGKVPPGAIPEQIEYALGVLGHADEVKLYNSGSFFDHKAIPIQDYAAIADKLRGFQRVVVESHPSLVGDDCLRFRDMLGGRLEVAMGLETAHPGVLDRLNKGITLDSFMKAADFLKMNDIDMRVFILVKPPFLNEEEALEWACLSLDFATEAGSSVSTLIPTRGGNGAMDLLEAEGLFAPPSLFTLEQVLDYGISLNKGRVFADLWDLRQFSTCDHCFEARKSRLEKINLTQQWQPYRSCAYCRYDGSE